MTIKHRKYIKINSVNPLYLIFNKLNEYFEEISRNKYLPLAPTNENKEKIKKFEELWIKIRDLIRSITKNSDDYDDKYMKIKYNSDDELPLNKTIEIPTMTVVVRAFLKDLYIKGLNVKKYSSVDWKILSLNVLRLE